MAVLFPSNVTPQTEADPGGLSALFEQNLVRFDIVLIVLVEDIELEANRLYKESIWRSGFYD